MLVAGYAISDPPTPLFTSDSRVVAVTCIVVAKSRLLEKKSWQPSMELRTCSTSNPSPTVTTGYADSYWSMVYRYWNAQYDR